MTGVVNYRLCIRIYTLYIYILYFVCSIHMMYIVYPCDAHSIYIVYYVYAMYTHCICGMVLRTRKGKAPHHEQL